MIFLEEIRNEILAPFAKSLKKQAKLLATLNKVDGHVVDSINYREVIINLGSANGIKNGMLFAVFSKEENIIAYLEIVNVDKYISTGRSKHSELIKLTKSNNSDYVKINDKVRLIM